MLVVGLTGGIGSGKSTVAALLAGHGATVIDVDGLGRAVIEPDGAAYAGVVARFGPAVLDGEGRVDRPALARIVFGHPEELADLNAISHPAINAALAKAVADADPAGVVVFDMAVLVESDLGQGPGGPLYQMVVVVEAPEEVRLERLQGRGLSVEVARARMASQATDAQRRARAQVVIDNAGDEHALRRRVAELWDDLKGRSS